MRHEIKGQSFSTLHVTLDAQEGLIASPGSLIALEQGISFDTSVRAGSGENGIIGATKRLLTNEHVLLNVYKNTTHAKRFVIIGSDHPGEIVPIHQQNYTHEIICQKGAFLAGPAGCTIDIELKKNVSFGVCSGHGFILQRIRGCSLVFLQGAGSVENIQITNDTIMVDSAHVLAFTDNLSYRLKVVRGLKNILFGGEGLFMMEISGTGTIWLQSHPFAKLADQIVTRSKVLSDQIVALNTKIKKTTKKPNVRI